MTLNGVLTTDAWCLCGSWTYCPVTYMICELIAGVLYRNVEIPEHFKMSQKKINIWLLECHLVIVSLIVLYLDDYGGRSFGSGFRDRDRDRSNRYGPPRDRYEWNGDRYSLLLYHYPKYAIVIGPNSCWPVQRSALPAGRHPMHSRLIFGLNAILGTSVIYSALHNVDRKLRRNCRFIIKKVYKSFSFAFCIL